MASGDVSGEVSGELSGEVSGEASGEASGQATGGVSGATGLGSGPASRPAVGRMDRAERWAWSALVLVWAGYLLAGVVDPGGPGERVLKGLLMPALLGWVLAALGSATPRWLAAGLVLAAVGDVAIDVTVLAGLVGFLVMQLCYIVGFLRLGALAGLRRRWPLGVAYLLLWLAVNLLVGPSMGGLGPPVLLYSAALCTMAAFAAGTSVRVGAGACLFLLSDLLIAIDLAGIELPGGSLVMPTYLTGQYLIATGWVRAVHPAVALPA